MESGFVNVISLYGQKASSSRCPAHQVLLRCVVTISGVARGGMMPEVDLYTELSEQGSYKVLELTPELLRALREDEVEFKASGDSSEVVLCSSGRTWALKQRNHSNTVLLMKEVVVRGAGAEWLGYSRQMSELEARPREGQVDVSVLPIYSGSAESLAGARMSVEEVRGASPCSEREFYERWHRAAGCSVGGVACVLSQELISRALHITLMTVLAESLEMGRLEFARTYECIAGDLDEEGHPYTAEVIRTVLWKFGRSEDGGASFAVDPQRVSQWYGTCALKQFASREPISEKEFLIHWKSLFPPYFECDLDLELLRGHFVRPLPKKIQHCAKNTLSMDTKERFKQLFKLQSSWMLEDLVPFIAELNTKELNVEAFVMKYARRKKVGSSVVVTSR